MEALASSELLVLRKLGPNVQNDVSNVLIDAFNRSELMLNAIHLMASTAAPKRGKHAAESCRRHHSRLKRAPYAHERRLRRFT